jgi:dTDP-4-dehydrorhamnose 3,5-epimerase
MLLIEPRCFRDDRGSFFESFHTRRYREAGIDGPFVQDCFSRSTRGVVRGLHYQIRQPQGKLCSVLEGEVFDVAVDLRRESPTFGQWEAVNLSAANGRQVYLPPGVAHGFCVLSDEALFHYKCTEYYAPKHERTLAWNDPQLAIAWPVDRPVLSPKDQCGVPWREAEFFDDGATSLPDFLL